MSSLQTARKKRLLFKLPSVQSSAGAARAGKTGGWSRHFWVTGFQRQFRGEVSWFWVCTREAESGVDGQLTQGVMGEWTLGNRILSPLSSHATRPLGALREQHTCLERRGFVGEEKSEGEQVHSVFSGGGVLSL